MGRGHWGVLLGAALVAASVFLGSVARAEYVWTLFSTYSGATAEEACSNYCDSQSAVLVSCDGVVEPKTYDANGVLSRAYCGITRDFGSGPQSDSFEMNRSGTESCPAGYELDAEAGGCVPVSGPKPPTWPLFVWQDNPNFPPTQCVEGTLWEKPGVIIETTAGRWSTTYISSGESCEADGTTDYDVAPTVDDEGCVTSVNGNVMCRSNQPDPTNCGTVNGDVVCLASVPPGKCTILAGGSYICDGAASTPPAPNNGTEGVPAPVDDRLWAAEEGSLRAFSYYSTSTVNQSTSHQGTLVGEDGTVPEEGAEFEEATDTSGLTYDFGPLDDATGGAGSVDTGYLPGTGAAPDIGFSGTNGACPLEDQTASVMGMAVRLDGLCWWAEKIRDVLYWVFAVLTAWFLLLQLTQFKSF